MPSLFPPSQTAFGQNENCWPCWKPYYTLKGVLHALCNAHHLRELQALVEIEKEDWARKMQCLLRRACHASNLAREQGVTLSPGFIALIERCYDAILMEGFAFHEAQPTLISTARKRRGRVPRRTGHNLLLRLRVRRQDVLRFLSDPTVPFTNNLAERDGRMMKLRQKISGGFRSVDGAEDFAVTRSLLSTARKQGVGYLTGIGQSARSSDRGTPGRLTQAGLPGLLRKKKCNCPGAPAESGLRAS
jgi:transposase